MKKREAQRIAYTHVIGCVTDDIPSLLRDAPDNPYKVQRPIGDNDIDDVEREIVSIMNILRGKLERVKGNAS